MPIVLPIVIVAVALGLAAFFVARLAGRLRRAEAAAARHFELSLDPIWVTGPEGDFRSVNPAFERALGYREEALLGRRFVELVDPEDRERTVAEVAAILEGGATGPLRGRWLDGQGAPRWFEWTPVPLPAEGSVYAVARDTTERIELEAELERVGQRDPLTGLFNRRRFEEQLRHQLAYTRRYGSGGALMVMDLDRFKAINDEHGQAIGDQVLCEVAGLLSDNLRGGDAVVARLDGDGFAAMLPEADGSGALAAAERLIAALGASPPSAGGRELGLGISIGVALFDEHGLPGERELLRMADRAMHEAKLAGGRGAALATSDLRAGPGARLL